MRLDMSDFRISLSLGHLRYYAEKDAKGDYDAGNRSGGYFCCRGHHHDPVFDYKGMPGAYPILLTFPYLSHRSPLAENFAEPLLQRSIYHMIFGSEEGNERQPGSSFVGMNPVKECLDLRLPTFFALIIDPCMYHQRSRSTILLTHDVDTIITQSSHDIQSLLSDSLTVDVFENVKPPDLLDDDPLESGVATEQHQMQVEIQITDCTIKLNRQYILPNLPNRRWKVSLYNFSVENTQFEY